ncbi:MAG: STAS-like domain-containing protein [Achromobacter sp.]|uniref:STAS-like domain-containing protein n=1 Tax=unclassified Achromobacter TaxID=2626865 RepID=UPI0009E7D18E|nr:MULTISPECIES: STAS-like domain-containing protein [unclassified Achromobacter]MBN9642522.1 STAS-like domain-containing protein [Achromobacter sp.]
MKQVNVANDFTRFPSGRYKKKGGTSGEAFRERFLLPALHEHQSIEIELDGVLGYGSSFLEEAFGGAIRQAKVKADEFFRLIHLKSSNQALIREIHQYVEEASKRLRNG